MKRLPAVLILLGLSCVLPVLAVQAEEQKWCPVCGMNLKMFWRTSHWFTFTDGKKTGYCSIHCASSVYKDRATEIDAWQTVDYDNQQLIDARKAHFLIGSDLPGTMTAVSKLAFASADVARKYQAKHGGQIGTLDDALKRTLADSGSDMAMIKKKVAEMAIMGKSLAAKHGCFKCHGEDGTGGTAVAWNSRESAQRLKSRVTIKEKITRGSQKMKVYRDGIPEQELHAIALYVWTRLPR